MVSNKLFAKILVQRKKNHKKIQKESVKNAERIEFRVKLSSMGYPIGKIHDKIKFTPKMKFTTKFNLYAN